MQKRFVSIWFRYLKTDWFVRRKHVAAQVAFVLAAPHHGRLIVQERNLIAGKQGIEKGMTVADAKAIVPGLEVMDDKPELAATLLTGIAEWAIRFTPVVGVDLPDGLLMDVTGCPHLWGGESKYLADISRRLEAFGYHVHTGMADTIGAAWAVARFGNTGTVVENGRQKTAVLSFPPAALRLEADLTALLEKLGLRSVGDFINLPRTALRRRFGKQILLSIDECTGDAEEWVEPVHPQEPYQERLPCLEPIVSRKGIEIALQQLLESVCYRLQQEQKGLRIAVFKGYRIDGNIQQLQIGTNRANCNVQHLYKLFELKIENLTPALGIELFTLDAIKVEDLLTQQEQLWKGATGLNDAELNELLDRIGGKIGAGNIRRYVPEEHYWPENSYKTAASIDEKLQTYWKLDRPRPLQLLSPPETIQVMAPVPDYPPLHFRYKGKLHTIKKADGPERIEQEWWLQDGEHRDYYVVEDETGNRYWLFRLGHYHAAKTHHWFIHGFFT